jgi:hypothetical protein
MFFYFNYRTPYQDSLLYGGDVTPTSQDRASAMLFHRLQEIKRTYDVDVTSNVIISIGDFRKIS